MPFFLPVSFHVKIICITIICFVVGAQTVHAEGFWDTVSGFLSDGTSASGPLTDSDIVSGLKAALDKGTHSAVSSLGRTDGYYQNKRVKIPLPKTLEKAESALRLVGQEKYADDFVLSMNRAAEKAVPEATAIFADSIKQMSIADARNILNGPDDAATRYFERTGGKKLHKNMLPIIKTATANTGVTAQYKAMIGKLGPAADLVDSDMLDLDSYITQKALDGLFLLVADEERAIRKNPAARTSEILKKVFSQ